MATQQSSNINMRVETATVRGTGISYGSATEISVRPGRYADSSVSLSLSSQASFLFAEYFKGILFVAACAFFIFVVPAYLAKPAVIRQMIGVGLKRTLDIFGSIVGLVLTLPFWVVIPILIKLDSRGPVFYSQTRVGTERRKESRRYHQKTEVDNRRSRERRRDNVMGIPFKVIKFRTMVVNAEAKTGPVWATRNDSRITKLGAFLRKTRIDEIPQFLNVLVGDMSLVGPRPERPSFVRDLSGRVENYSRRLEVKPGLTGLAQVEGGYDSSIVSVAEKVKYDIEYIDNWSIWSDIKILLKTVIVVVTGRGAC